MKVTRDYKNETIHVDQSNYIREILDKFNMAESKPVTTPMDPNARLDQNMVPKTRYEIDEMRKVPYQEAVGSLLYLSQCTRPDIAYAVGIVSRYMKNPGKAHWAAVKRIFRYLKGTKDLKLKYTRIGEKSSTIYGWADADWATELDDRHSITGNVFKFQGSVISWASKKQKTVALSTTEAEYMALSASCQEAIWLRALAQEIDPNAVTEATNIFCDNKGAVDLAKTSGYRPRTKHIDVRHHFIRERIESGEITVKHISTENMVADSLTKPLAKQKLEFCNKIMGLAM